MGVIGDKHNVQKRLREGNFRLVRGRLEDLDTPEGRAAFERAEAEDNPSQSIGDDVLEDVNDHAENAGAVSAGPDVQGAQFNAFVNRGVRENPIEAAGDPVRAEPPGLAAVAQLADALAAVHTDDDSDHSSSKENKEPKKKGKALWTAKDRNRAKKTDKPPRK